MQTFRTVRVLSNGHIFRPAIRQASYSTMKALVYRAVGDVKLEERPKPKITQATDAIVKLTKSTICGTDLHIAKGDVATCTPGTILGHEGVGIIDEIGNSVRGFKKGEHVLISCICSCASCEYCRKGMYSHCTTGGMSISPKGNQYSHPQVGFLETQLMAHKLNTSEFLMPTPPSIPYPPVPTKLHWSC